MPKNNDMFKKNEDISQKYIRQPEGGNLQQLSTQNHHFLKRHKPVPIMHKEGR